jgi:isocitrate lyase
MSMKKDFVMPIKQQVPEKKVDPDLSPEFQYALSLFSMRKVIEYLQYHPCHI